MKKLSLLLVFIIILTFIFYKYNYPYKKVRREIIDTIHVMEKYPFVYFHVTDEEEMYKQMKRCKWLYRNATEEELQQLIHYPSSSIKANVVYLFLIIKNDSSIISTVKKNSYDTINVLIYYHDYREITLNDFIEDLKIPRGTPPFE